MKDVRHKADGKCADVIPGQGELDLRHMIELLAQDSYRGYLCLEWEKKWHPEIPLLKRRCRPR